MINIIPLGFETSREAIEGSLPAGLPYEAALTLIQFPRFNGEAMTAIEKPQWFCGLPLGSFCIISENIDKSIRDRCMLCYKTGDDQYVRMISDFRADGIVMQVFSVCASESARISPAWMEVSFSRREELAYSPFDE